MDNHHEEPEEDQDSLFGSPPPSPQIRGRNSSPLLALPTGNVISSGMSTTTAIQNVGTIALPGSQPVSELPINPLALSLNHGVVSRPPAPQVTDQVVSRQSSMAPDSAGPSTPNIRASSISSGKSRKRARQQSQSQQANFPHAREPEFSLPNPSAPPPAHFLRNQENLLGQAGLVAGVKPATITHTRGATSSNPIVIEDEDAPTIGRSTQFRDPNKRYIDPSLLTAPSNQEIVQVLIGQKDIFPVLESILKLLAGSHFQMPAPPTGFERRDSIRSNTSRTSASSSNLGADYPAKKRKLNRVPAGATDWDVPYPFAQGEGPEAYHSNWQRERGKQLISQLVKLIKGAARKAATKIYLQKEKAVQDAIEQQDQAAQAKALQLEEEERRTRINNHYRPETATYGMEEQTVNRQIHQVLKDASNGSHLHISTSSLGPHATTFSPIASPGLNSQNQAGKLPPQNRSNTFDKLITTLVAASPNQSQEPNSQAIPFNTDHIPSTMADFENPIPGTGDSLGIDDSTLFNTWMHFLQTFPVSFDGHSDLSGFPTPVPSKSSTPGLDDFSFPGSPATDFNYGSTALEHVNTDGLDSLLSAMFSQDNTSQGMDVSAMMTVDRGFSEFSTIQDNMIDPDLLAISNTSDPGSAYNAGSVVSQVASPIPSATSYADTGPATPSSANWEASFPDVFMNIEMENEGGGQDGNGAMVDFGVVPEEGGVQPLITRVDKGKAKATDYFSTTTVTPTPASRSPSEPLAAETTLPSLSMVSSSELFTRQPPRPAISVQPSVVAMARKARREDVLKRVEEKKRRLQEELDQTRVKLWETTVEQAALMHIVSHRR